MNKKRETEKLLEIEGRNFKIKKLDPLLGNYILATVMTAVLPMGLGGMIQKKTGMNMPTGGAELSKAKFLELQRDILSVCYEVLPAGDAPVVREDGTYGIGDFTATLAMGLLTASMAFNFVDFFAEALSTPEAKDEAPSA